MEKRRHLDLRRGMALVAGISLAGCRIWDAPGLTDTQQTELAAYVEAYHFCVARAASRMDDGQSAIVDISMRALGYCEPEAHGVATYLDSTKLSTATKDDYVAQLIAAAENRSDVMLRRLRDRESGTRGI